MCDVLKDTSQTDSHRNTMDGDTKRPHRELKQDSLCFEEDILFDDYGDYHHWVEAQSTKVLTL